MASKRGGKTQAKRGGGLKTGLILVTGLALGLGLAAAYLMFGDRQKLDAILPQPNPQAEAPAPRRDAEPVAQEPEEATEAPKPTYDFYTVLPEKEVELPGETAEATAPGSTAPASTAPTTAPAATAGTTPPSAAPAAPSGLQLQAGAFGNAGDAEALRARLALVGQMARIETVQANGRTLHRVRLGPYADVAARDAAQKALAEAGVTATPAR
ncbi:SPOR domain-containing protein [Silanimonas sp.]|jgi:cell division protein FtsN|uniref:SPOR domain-containing protein n=1 Tax=Silanimonas sp. TaxID=1929290 RepID=UPI0022BD3F0F|nr:SPOR domain-containing protein [Silanimonas sp.]MCZ8114706.1 SPOR domain-containing protein [Silanimonas sp.]